MGLSAIHSSKVPLVLNTTTGSITSQNHVVFDDAFSTVTSVERKTEPPPFWDDLCLENTTYVPVETPPDQPLHLDDDWLTETKRATKKIRAIARREEIRSRLAPTPTQHVPSCPARASMIQAFTPEPLLPALRPPSDAPLAVPTVSPTPTITTPVSQTPFQYQQTSLLILHQIPY